MKSLLRRALAIWLLMPSAHHWFFCSEVFASSMGFFILDGPAHPVTIGYLVYFWIIAHSQNIMKQYTAKYHSYAVSATLIELLSLSLPVIALQIQVHWHTLLLVLSLILIVSAGIVITRIQSIYCRNQIH